MMQRVFIPFVHVILHPAANRHCKYGGDTEYWVETGETGEKGQEKQRKKERKEIVDDLRVCAFRKK